MTARMQRGAMGKRHRSGQREGPEAGLGARARGLTDAEGAEEGTRPRQVLGVPCRDQTMRWSALSRSDHALVCPVRIRCPWEGPAVRCSLSAVGLEQSLMSDSRSH